MNAKKGSALTSRHVLAVVKGFFKGYHAYTTQEWDRALGKLNQELCRAKSDPESTPVDHSQIEDVLPFYVSDEQMGQKVRQIYPDIWAHLQTCPACRELYEVYAAEPSPAERAARKEDV